MPKHASPPTDAAPRSGLRYIGNGAARVGIPARDLTPDELTAIAAAYEQSPRDLCAALLESGLYTATGPEPVEAPPAAAEEA